MSHAKCPLEGAYKMALLNMGSDDVYRNRTENEAENLCVNTV